MAPRKAAKRGAATKVGSSEKKDGHGKKPSSNAQQPSKSSPKTSNEASAEQTSGPASNRGSIIRGRIWRSGITKNDLIKRLRDLHEALQGIDQEEKVDYLDQVAAELVSHELLEHSDKDVKLYTACCLVDILRLFAPKAPYTQVELKDIFTLIINQLRGLGSCTSQDARFMRYYYVLESLATVKSCVILVELDQHDALHDKDAEEEESLLVQMFECLFSTIREDHSTKVETYMLDIMSTCIDECDDISQKMLDVILLNLLPSYRSSGNQKPYLLAQNLIRKTAMRMQPVISQFLNAVIIDNKQLDSELSDNIYTLVYELHKISPSLLLYVLPNICLQLHVDELKVRQETVALLGRLFASSHAEYGEQYRKNFREFLGRFKDVSKEIRLQMIQIGCILLQRKPNLAPLISEELKSRLADPDWEVRRKAVNEICDVAANDLTCVEASLIKEVGERMKDKKIPIRKETMTGLAQVYATHLSSKLQQNPEYLSTTEGAKVLEKLRWVPEYVLKCYAFTEMELRFRVLQLLDDILLPKQASEEARGRILLCLFDALDSTGKEALRRILLDRRQTQQFLQRYLELRSQLRTCEASEQKEVEARLHQVLVNIIGVLPPTENAISLITEKLHKLKDQRIFKHLLVLSSPESSAAMIKESKDYVLKSLGTKTAIGEYVKLLIRKCSMATINVDTMEHLIAFVKEAGEGESEKRQRGGKHSSGQPAAAETGSQTTSALELIRITANIFPDAIADISSDLITMLDSKQEASVLSTLQILSVVGDEVKTKKISAKLVEFCTTGTPAQAKHAMGVLCNMHHLDSKRAHSSTSEIRKVVQKLATNLMEENDKLATHLSALAKLAKVRPHIFEEFAQTVQEDLLGNILDFQTAKANKGKGRKKSASAAASEVSRNRVRAMKVLANRWLMIREGEAPATTTSSYIFMEEDALVDQARPVLELLFSVISKAGKMDDSYSEEEAAELRCGAATGLLKLTRNPAIDKLILPTDWHKLAWTIQDPEARVRQSIIRKLRNSAVRHQTLNLKYISYLVLAAMDPEPLNKKEAKSTLVSAIKAMRLKHEQEGLSTKGKDAIKVLLMPEYLVPYALHLIAHHPDYPERPDGARAVTLSHYLHFLLDPLVSLMGAEADNVSFLLQLLDKMSRLKDAVTGDSERISFLVDQAVSILKRKIKNQENLKPFPGSIFIPESLYSVKNGTKGAVRRDSAGSSAGGPGKASPAVNTSFSSDTPDTEHPSSPAGLSPKPKKHIHMQKFRNANGKVTSPAPRKDEDKKASKKRNMKEGDGSSSSAKKGPKKRLSVEGNASSKKKGKETPPPSRVQPSRRARPVVEMADQDSDVDLSQGHEGEEEQDQEEEREEEIEENRGRPEKPGASDEEDVQEPEHSEPEPTPSGPSSPSPMQRRRGRGGVRSELDSVSSATPSSTSPSGKRKSGRETKASPAKRTKKDVKAPVRASTRVRAAR